MQSLKLLQSTWVLSNISAINEWKWNFIALIGPLLEGLMFLHIYKTAVLYCILMLVYYFVWSARKGSSCCLVVLLFKCAFLLFAFVYICVALGDPPVLGFDMIPWWGILLISLACGLLTSIVVWFIVCPRLKKKIERKSHFCQSDSLFNSMWLSFLT